MYFSSKSSKEPSAVIDILDIASIRPFENNDKGAYSFVLKTPKRSYFLRTTTEGDMKRWVRGLREQQDLWRQKRSGGETSPTRRPKHYRDEKKPSSSTVSDPQRLSNETKYSESDSCSNNSSDEEDEEEQVEMKSGRRVSVNGWTKASKNPRVDYMDDDRIQTTGSQNYDDIETIAC